MRLARLVSLADFARDRRAATSAEFALVLPLMLLFLLGIIDVGRYAWNVNQLEKAAQMGVRFAVVTNPVEGGLTTTSYVGNTACSGGVALTPGDPICREAFGREVCTSAGCTCASSPCVSTSFQSAAFANVLARVQDFAPSVAAANLNVEYAGSGIGYAADPDMALAPVVTVALVDVDFTAISLLGITLSLPDVRRSLTMEDGTGSVSN